MQHPYVYGVLVFEAMATFVGQVSVLSLIALFGAATTAMVSSAFSLYFCVDSLIGLTFVDIVAWTAWISHSTSLKHHDALILAEFTNYI